MRDVRRRLSGVQAEELEAVAEVVRECRADVPASLGADARPAMVEELALDLAVSELACVVGIGGAEAKRLIELSRRLTSVLPQVLESLSSGAIDVGRARDLAQATEVLDDRLAADVTRELLGGTQSWEGPWDGPSPRVWRAQAERAAVRADPDAARRRRERALAARRVRAWAEGDGTGVLQVRAAVEDVALAEQVVTDLARARPPADDDGVVLTLDQRRSDALMDVFRRLRSGGLEAATSLTGDASAKASVRRVHDLGLVLHVDTLYGDGPAAHEPGELRGLGTPTAVDPASAQTMARRQVSRGATVQVLVVDGAGAVRHVVPLERGSAQAVLDRDALLPVVRAAIESAPPLTAATYEPTAAITRHVHAAAPTCSFYDCPRQARRCDLDHDDPWPRGPTSVTNLDPKCRRHHRQKTLGLAWSRLRAVPGEGPRRVTWTLRNGLQVTTAPGPLPGCDHRLRGTELPAGPRPR